MTGTSVSELDRKGINPTYERVRHSSLMPVLRSSGLTLRVLWVRQSAGWVSLPTRPLSGRWQVIHAIAPELGACPYRKFCAAHGEYHSPGRTAKVKHSATLLESGGGDSATQASARKHS